VSERLLAGGNIESLFQFGVCNYKRIAAKRRQAAGFVRVLWPWRNSPDGEARRHIRYWIREARSSDLERVLLHFGLTLQDLCGVLEDLGVNPLLTTDPVSGPIRLLGESRRLAPHELAEWKLGPGSRFGGPPSDREWNEPREAALRGRLGKLSRWELIGDYVVKLYDLIAPRVPARRRSLRWGAGAVANTYNTSAGALVAMIVNLHFGEFFSRPMMPPDVKSRLQARGVRGVSE